MNRSHVLVAVLCTYLGMAIGVVSTLMYSPTLAYAQVKTNNSLVFSPEPTTVYTESLPPVVLPGYLETVKISYYRPELGGTNCSRFVNGECISRMASGERWQDWYGRAAACPREWPFWTKVILPGSEEFFCLDRGGAIKYGADGLTFIDLLVKESPVPFGTQIQVRVIPP